MNYTKIIKNNSLKKNNVFSGFLLVIAFLILLSLGTWQVERLQWKKRLLGQIEGNIRISHLKVPVIDNSIIDFNYRNVMVEGNFLPKLSINLEPRTHKGVAGVHVITPFYSEKKHILVNRGFVPYEYLNAFNKNYKNITEEKLIIIKGIARLYGKKRWPIPNNDLIAGKWFFLNIADISKYLGLKLEPYVIELTKNEDGQNYPISNITIIDIPNNHLQYAITWYALALTLAILIIFLSNKPDELERF